MKKTIFLIAVMAFAFKGIAQQGSWYIGGLAGYGSSTNKDANDNKTVTSNWAVGPEFGTFLSDNLQLGFVTGLSGSSRKMGDNKDYSSTSFSPTVYVRHFYTITEIFSAFGGLYLGYISGSMKEYDYSTGSEVEMKSSRSGFSGRVGIGVALALSPRFTAVGQYGLLGFSSVSNKNNDGEKTSTDSSFDFGVNTIGGNTFVQGNGSGSVFNIGIYYTIKE
jgi:hypothetical protein